MSKEARLKLLNVEFVDGFYILKYKDRGGEGIMKTKSFDNVVSYIELILKRHDTIQGWDCLTVEGGFE